MGTTFSWMVISRRQVFRKNRKPAPLTHDCPVLQAKVSSYLWSSLRVTNDELSPFCCASASCAHMRHHAKMAQRQKHACHMHCHADALQWHGNMRR